MDFSPQLIHLLPLVLTGMAGLVVMMLDAFTGNSENAFRTTFLFCVLALAASVMSLLGVPGEKFYSLLVFGGTASFGMVLVLMATLATVVLTRDYLKHIARHKPEVYTMMLFAAFGMLLMVSSNNLVSLFLGIETMSISLYVLAGLLNNEKKGVEAALKYFLLGAFSTGFLLYGMALLYGASGSTFLPDIAAASQKGLIYWAGIAFLLIGFFFKIAAVPFHMWTPDVYEGAPTTITAFMATASKAATFVAFILVLSRALPEAGDRWGEVMGLIALFTMVVGNLLALVQENVKRMLAYSSIAHAGYIMIGLAVATPAAYSAVLFYLFAYTLMNLGAFGVVAFYEWHKGFDFTQIKNYSGLGYQQPLMGILMAIFLFSMIGIPPFAGFIGKYRVFAAAVDEGLISLVVVGVLASAASVYYYLRVLVFLYMHENENRVVLWQPGILYRATLLLLAALTIFFGIHPGSLSDLLLTFS